MKKKYVLVLLIAVFGLGISVDKFLFTNNEIKDEEVDVPKSTHEHMLSMMLEQNAGVGDYSLETRSSWPTQEEGYVFNSSLSKCERGSKLQWDDVNKVVVMVGTTSDKCYVYFDIYEPSITLADWVKSQYTGTQGENNLYYHDSTLENGANDNSYRYAGPSDTVNNFVCFGSDDETCPDDNLYRIIGVFGDQVKLIKWDYATSTLLGTDGDYKDTYQTVSSGNWGTSKGTNAKTAIGAYWWNYDGADYGTNTWSASELNTVNLNTNYLNNIGTEWENKIATTTWKVGGNTWANIGTAPVANAYQNEYVNPAESTTETKKIGLMYTSDYGFAASPSIWTSNLYNYNSYINDNWMYMGLHEWTVVRHSEVPTYAFRVSLVGYVDSFSVGRSDYASGVRPVFYLESSVNYVSGSGTKSEPIRIN